MPIEEGGVKLTVLESSPTDVAKLAHRFLEEVVPAQIFPQPVDTEDRVQRCEEQRLIATVFWDYVPLRIELCTYTETDKKETTLMFLDRSHNDIIRCKHVLDNLVAFLLTEGLQVHEPLRVTRLSGGLLAHGPRPQLMVDDDMSMSDDEEDSWTSRVDLMWDDALSPDSALREEAFRYLAHSAASAPDSHAAIAKGFADFQLGLTLFADPHSSLAEMYLAASALQHMGTGESPDACDILAHAPSFQALAKFEVSDLPPLVARELALAVDSISLWKTFSQKVVGKAGPEGSMGTASTRCSDTAPIFDPGLTLQRLNRSCRPEYEYDDDEDDDIDEGNMAVSA